jgi:signal recognition particle GTPase
MLDSLSDRLNTIFRKLKGHGKLTEKNIEDGLKEVRMALLEADVHYRVVKSFIGDIKERAMGQEVLESLTPGQQVIKIVNQTLTKLMGARHEQLNLSGTSPVSVMLVGLQGSGKTTTAGKLSVFLRKKGHGSGRCLSPGGYRTASKAGQSAGCAGFPVPHGPGSGSNLSGGSDRRASARMRYAAAGYGRAPAY